MGGLHRGEGGGWKMAELRVVYCGKYGSGTHGVWDEFGDVGAEACSRTTTIPLWRGWRRLVKIGVLWFCGLKVAK
jgi:hypothetical protein